MPDPASSLDALLDLEARHEDLLDRLDALDQKVEQVLRQWQGGRAESTDDRPPSAE